MDPLKLEDVLVIGENDAGWQFGVGRILGDRWLGFAMESSHAQQARSAFAGEGLQVEPGFMMIFPEVAEGYQLGMADRDRAIRIVGAIAEDRDGDYFGVDRWFVPEELRGKPADFRCAKCGRVGCDGKTCGEEDYDGDW